MGQHLINTEALKFHLYPLRFKRYSYILCWRGWGWGRGCLTRYFQFGETIYIFSR